MSSTKYEVELSRAMNDKKSNEIGKLSGNVRVIGLNNLQTGDVVTIPSGYKVFEQEISGSDATAEYIIANVKRGETETALRFYPSSFFKMGTTAVAGADGNYTRGEFVHASGTVCDEVQNYADLSEAVDALTERPFNVVLTPVSLVTFEARDKQELTKDDVRNTTIPQYNF